MISFPPSANLVAIIVPVVVVLLVLVVVVVVALIVVLCLCKRRKLNRDLAFDFQAMSTSQKTMEESSFQVAANNPLLMQVEGNKNGQKVDNEVKVEL